jgi:hypothetical protein
MTSQNTSQNITYDIMFDIYDNTYDAHIGPGVSTITNDIKCNIICVDSVIFFDLFLGS